METLDKQLHIKMTEEMDEYLKRKSAMSGNSKASIVRNAVAQQKEEA